MAEDLLDHQRMGSGRLSTDENLLGSGHHRLEQRRVEDIWQRLPDFPEYERFLGRKGYGSDKLYGGSLCYRPPCSARLSRAGADKHVHQEPGTVPCPDCLRFLALQGTIVC